MNRSIYISVLMCVAAVLVMSTAAHAEKIKNPEYAKWEMFKPGAYAKLKGTGGSPGHTILQTITTTLLEINAEKAVIEIRVSISDGARQMEMDPIKQEINANIELTDAKKPEGMNDNNTAVNASHEKITIGDKTYDCVVNEVIMNRSGMKVTVKTWSTSDVPGGQVKVRRTTDGKTLSITEMTLIDAKSGSE